jgi:hypothetical protein
MPLHAPVVVDQLTTSSPAPSASARSAILAQTARCFACRCVQTVTARVSLDVETTTTLGCRPSRLPRSAGVSTAELIQLSRHQADDRACRLDSPHAAAVAGGILHSAANLRSKRIRPGAVRRASMSSTTSSSASFSLVAALTGSPTYFGAWNPHFSQAPRWTKRHGMILGRSTSELCGVFRS